jgi:uncharacterized RDD family membrane protein YckC
MTQGVNQQMGQCAVTGKMVPEDELVTIQGQRVCAEGKAILLDRLKAGESMPGELERPTILRRFGCIFVDGLIVGLPFAILNAILTRGNPNLMLLGLVTLVSAAVQVVYFGQMHAAGGQTLGKKAGKLRVVNLDGSPISLQTAYIRALAYAGPGALLGLTEIAGMGVALMAANVIVGVYGLTDVIFALVDQNMQRALHDRIAGTRVIQLN